MKAIRDFLGYTSLHGLGRVEGGVNLLQKVVWLFLFMISSGMCFFQVSRLAIQFQSFQVTTNIEFEYKPKRLPGVAICNLNVVQYSDIQDSPGLMDILRAFSDFQKMPINSFPGTTYNASLYNITKPFRVRKPVSAVTMFRLRLANTNRMDIRQNSQAFSDFITRCMINGQPCGEGNFTAYRDGLYRMCYSINSRSMVYKAGHGSGLELVLNVDQGNYVPFLADSAGVAIHIFDPDHSADLSATGDAYPTGLESNIGLTEKVINRLPGSSGRCDVNNTYSSILFCIMQCQDKRIKEACGCAARHDLLDLENGIDFCQTPDDIVCVEEMEMAGNSGNVCPNCMLPCKETKYIKSVSYTTWPADKYEPILRNIHGPRYNKAKDDMLLIRVFYESLLTEIVTEEPAYTAVNFVSDIGGQLGLWIGMSILSLAEVVELFVLIATSCFRAKKTEDVNSRSSNHLTILVK